jgi:hypothetical protein
VIDTVRDLRTAEDDLQVLRGLLAEAVAFIHDPAYDDTARRALARRLNLPEPRTYATRKDTGDGRKFQDRMVHGELEPAARL